MKRQTEAVKETNDGTTPAPEGQVWICGACGKKSRTMYGFDAENKSTAIDRGWDESCMLNAVLCYSDLRADDKGVLGYRAVTGTDS